MQLNEREEPMVFPRRDNGRTVVIVMPKEKKPGNSAQPKNDRVQVFVR